MKRTNISERRLALFVLTALLAATPFYTSHGETAKPNAVVAADGSGQFRTIQAAVDAVPENNTKQVVISIKPGIYKERIVVPRGKRFIRFVGEYAEKTVLTFDLNANIKGDDGRPIGTFRTPSTTIEADDFSADNITFENSAGPVGQALAITIIGDRAVFRNCRFLGWQDTLLSQTGRHYFENCYITGHVDFIFGGATAFFESCHIHCLRNGYITAASTPEQQKYGYVFSSCKITGESPDVKTYLGRPWRPFASVTFLNTEMSEVVRPVGWDNWRDPNREKTSRYAEFNSTGPGANSQARVTWARQLTESEAKDITREKVLGGIDGWNPKTGDVKISVRVTPASSNESMSVNNASKANGFVYLFAFFRGNGENGLNLAYSFDGYHWSDLGDSFLKPDVGTNKVMRNPSVAQGPDGTFHIVWTTGVKDDKGFGYAGSKDLIHWSQQKFIKPMEHEKQTADVLSPQLFYDDAEQQFLIVWASTILPNRYQAYQEDTDNNPRLWYSATHDFETFTQAKIFFEPGYSVKDGVIVKDNTRYVLLHKDNRQMMENLRVAFADKPLGPWGPVCDPFTEKSTEGPAALRLGDEWIIYFDMYEKGQYGAVKTHDFITWTDITSLVSLPERQDHGTIFKAPHSVLEGLKQYKRIG
jgi:pectinesterase